MLYIGFSNHYYTLWSVNEVSKLHPDIPGAYYIITNYSYIQNLSYDLEAAKVKIKEIAGERETRIDLDLRGQFGKYYTKTRISNLPMYVFSFGKLIGQDMRISDDTWQLNRAMQQESAGRRKVIARRRLIELGELVKFAWTERIPFEREMTEAEIIKASNKEGISYDQWVYNYGSMCIDYNLTPRKWCPKRLHAYKLLDQFKGHHFQDGKRIELTIKQIGKLKFYENGFGGFFVGTYQDSENRIYKFKGSNPPQTDEIGDFIKVKATIKHEEYQGQKSTRIQRIKVL